VRVSVSGVVRDGQLRLTVANSGMPPEREHRDGAVGLTNTRERLQGLYGNAASVALMAGVAGGSVLTISLPMQHAP
jgi:LytS/YehU family sensor histidine kinase